MSVAIRLYNGLSFRLQVAMVFLSLVGLAFGVKSYYHVREIFGAGSSAMFYNDLIVQIGIAVVINIVIAMLTYKTVTHPIIKLCEAMRHITENKLNTEIPYVSLGNEIGSMARKVQIFKDNAVQLSNLESEQAKAREKTEAERKKLIEKLAGEFDARVRQIVDTVASSAGNMEGTSRSVVDSTTSSSHRIADLRNESSQASENVNNVAAAAEELSVSIERISEEVTRAAQITQSAVQRAEHANQTVKGLSDGADKIGKVVGIINDIAEQINLLALNATIEAARAGDAGKGFAVVASEVKNLANQTAKATEEISMLIESIQKETGGSVVSIQEIGQTVGEINSIATAIATAVREQDQATRDIARHINEAAEHTNSVSKNVAMVTESSEHIGASANNLLNACSELSKHSTALNEEVAHFVTTMKASA